VGAEPTRRTIAHRGGLLQQDLVSTTTATYAQPSGTGQTGNKRPFVRAQRVYGLACLTEYVRESEGLCVGANAFAYFSRKKSRSGARRRAHQIDKQRPLLAPFQTFLFGLICDKRVSSLISHPTPIQPKKLCALCGPLRPPRPRKLVIAKERQRQRHPCIKTTNPVGARTAGELNGNLPSGIELALSLFGRRGRGETQSTQKVKVWIHGLFWETACSHSS
jgi:hypothetical protein